MAPPHDKAAAPAAAPVPQGGAGAAEGGPAPEICLWCRKGDYTLHYGPRMLLTCDMCLQAFCHVACDAVRHSRPALTAKQVNSDAPWFCCTDCSEVAAALADETNAPRRPLEEHPQYTIELVRHDAALPPGRDAGCADYVSAVVGATRKIFAGSFAPLILDDGRDMLELICNSHFDPDGEDDVDYSAFRIAALRHRNTVVSVATLRVFGRGVAEMPFVATREAHRHAGNMRRLVGAVEAALRRWGVRRLVLPAITDVEHIWTRHFGMARMAPADRAAIENLVVTPEAGTAVMLWKDLTAMPTAAPAPEAAAPKAVPVPKAAAQARRVVGEGTFASLAAGAAADAAADAAAATIVTTSADAAAARAAARAAADAAAAREEAIGHALADALLSTMSDVDDERRAAQAARHELALRCAAQAARIAALEAALRATAGCTGADVAAQLAAIPPAEAPPDGGIEAEEAQAGPPADAAEPPDIAAAAAAEPEDGMELDAADQGVGVGAPPDYDDGDAYMAPDEAPPEAEAAAPADAEAAEVAPERQYIGVKQRPSGGSWYYDTSVAGRRVRAAGFASAEAAARAFDAACRALGRTDDLNFPADDVIEAPEEEQETVPEAPAAAVAAEEAAAEEPPAEPPAEPLAEPPSPEPPAAPAPPSPAADDAAAPVAEEADTAAAEAAPPAAAPPPEAVPPARRFVGVYPSRGAAGTWCFDISIGGARLREGGFAPDEAAARACDAVRRAHGRTHRLSFPDDAQQDAAPAQTEQQPDSPAPEPQAEAMDAVAEEAPAVYPPASPVAQTAASPPPEPVAAEAAAAAEAEADAGALLAAALAAALSATTGGAADAAAAAELDAIADALMPAAPEAAEQAAPPAAAAEPAPEAAPAAAAPRAFHGVRQRPGQRTWAVELRIGGQRLREVGFESAEAAARRHDAICRQHGRLDRLNFPDDDEAETTMPDATEPEATPPAMQDAAVDAAVDAAAPLLVAAFAAPPPPYAAVFAPARPPSPLVMMPEPMEPMAVAADAAAPPSVPEAAPTDTDDATMEAAPPDAAPMLDDAAAAAAILAMQLSRPRRARSLSRAARVSGASDSAPAPPRSRSASPSMPASRPYKGVRQRSDSSRWEFSLRCGVERVSKAGFDSAEAAARAYDAACRALGRTNKLNFPTQEAADDAAAAEVEAAAGADAPEAQQLAAESANEAAAASPPVMALTPLGAWLASLRLSSQPEAPPAEAPPAEEAPPAADDDAPPSALPQRGSGASARFSSGALREACSAMFASPPGGGDGKPRRASAAGADADSPPLGAGDAAAAISLAWQASSEFAAQ